jgi:dimethylaniline monooxygenase (N-oxide forming)
MVDKMINDAARHESVSPGTSKKEKLRLAGEKVRGEWRLVPCPSLAHKHPALQENFFSALYNQEIIPVHGFVDFVGDKKVILGNGQIVEVDVVIFATGYRHDFSLMPELEMDGAAGFPLATPGEVDREEPSLPRLFQMIFPPKWASSVAFLSWMAPQENVWCVCELASMAVTQVWAADVAQRKDLKAPTGYRPASLLPSQEEMDKEVDSYHTWWRKQWTVDHSVLPGYVRAYSFYRFLHEMAGTGLYEHLDHIFTSRGWWLWWNDYELWKWLAKGPMNSYSWRLFNTNPLQIPGRGRKTWSGARKAVEEAVSGAILLMISGLTRCSTTSLRISKQSRKRLIKDVPFLGNTAEPRHGLMLYRPDRFLAKKPGNRSLIFIIEHYETAISTAVRKLPIKKKKVHVKHMS